jgi:hypothetical protein
MRALLLTLPVALTLSGAELPPPFPADLDQTLERTCFQTGQSWSPSGDLRSDVAIVYGIDSGLPKRIDTWRERGYRIHVMTGVSWGQYQDYLYGRFDGINHEDEAQTDRDGHKVSHGGDVYYMCPGTNYGKFLCRGVQRALDAGAEAIHLEEPEFWVRSGYSEGFKREWQAFYNQPWQPPHSSSDAQWRASKLKYYLYRRALQQVFDFVQDYNQRTGKQVRCYVPTHSLLNYSHWNIVSPESSLAQLKGCDGYIAQVWTGTSRTPNVYQGHLRERTFETAFLEYGAMQNLVRSTGRRVWYLNDPVEDNPNHDWTDYRSNWESTLVASLLQPEVWRFEVAPWPERIFAGKYPRKAKASERVGIPAGYATELQIVMNALNELQQPAIEWDCGTAGLGVLISDSLMFERGQPHPSDPHLGHIYGMALPLLKRGMPITPVQLENVGLRGYLDPFRALLLTYQGMKPLGPEVDIAIGAWVKNGGCLVVVDDDSDPFNHVSEWWNRNGLSFDTPREHLFQQLGLSDASFDTDGLLTAGKGSVLWVRRNPASITAEPNSDQSFVESVRTALTRSGLEWKQANHLILRRGPFTIAAGLDESIEQKPVVIAGRYVNLFDPTLTVQHELSVGPGSRYFLIDLTRVTNSAPRVIASSCKALVRQQTAAELTLAVEGVENTEAIVLIGCPSGPPSRVTLGDAPLEITRFSAEDHLLWLQFTNLSSPRQLRLSF